MDSKSQDGPGVQPDTTSTRGISHKRKNENGSFWQGADRHKKRHVESSSMASPVGHTSNLTSNITPSKKFVAFQEKRTPLRNSSASSTGDISYQDSLSLQHGATPPKSEATDFYPSTSLNLTSGVEQDCFLPETHSSPAFNYLETANGPYIFSSPPKIRKKPDAEDVSLQQTRLDSDHLLPDTQNSPSDRSDITGLFTSPPKFRKYLNTNEASVQETRFDSDYPRNTQITPSGGSYVIGLLSSSLKLAKHVIAVDSSLQDVRANSDHLLPDTQINPQNSVGTKPGWLSNDRLISGTQRYSQAFQTPPIRAPTSARQKLDQLSFDHSLLETQSYTSSIHHRATFPHNPDDGLLPDTQIGGQSQAHGLAISPIDISDLQSDHGPPDTQALPVSRPPLICQPSTTSTPKLPLNKISCRERKRSIVSPKRPPSLTKSMRLWLSKTHSLLDPIRTSTECWFHPSPPPPRLTSAGVLRPYGKIQKTFTWTDLHGRHSIVLNYGICSKLSNNKMTKLQQDGWINNQWHLSHLCGNWTCLNPDHATVEPGAVNIGRNNCFSHRYGCVHEPRCLKELKAALGKDGLLVDHGGEEAEERIRRAYHWGDWWGWGWEGKWKGKGIGSVKVVGEGDEDLMVMDEDEEDESVGLGY